jgi:sugar fermentation stimulation protein A
MQFETTLIEGTLLRRDQRFVADIALKSGEEVSVHCANQGSLRSCNEPGSKVLLSELKSPRIKFRHQLEVIYSGTTPVGIHAGRPAGVVAEAIAQGQIPELAGYATLKRDNRKYKKTRTDLVVQGNTLRTCFLKVETVTMAEDGKAYFPDARYPNSQEIMQDLTDLVREGHRVMFVFVVQRADVETFRLADRIDSEFTAHFRDAVARGVETVCYRSHVSSEGISLDCPVPVDLSEEA